MDRMNEGLFLLCRLPWEDPSTAYGNSNSIPAVPNEILTKQARAAAKLAEEKVCGCNKPLPLAF